MVTKVSKGLLVVPIQTIRQVNMMNSNLPITQFMDWLWKYGGVKTYPLIYNHKERREMFDVNCLLKV